MNLNDHEIYAIPRVALANTIGDQALSRLTQLYADEQGLEVKHWCVLGFESGCLVPVPVQYEAGDMTVIRACRLYLLSIEGTLTNLLHQACEVVTVTLEIARTQLLELLAVKAVPHAKRNCPNANKLASL